MKAITLHQPWAELVADGAKQIETRSWNTWYRGPLAIHASKDRRVFKMMDMRKKSPIWCHFADKISGNFSDYFTYGAIVAVCNLVHVQMVPLGKDIVLNNEHGDRIYIPPNLYERYYGDYTPGHYAWILEDVQRLDEPIPARGMRRLWDVDPELKLPDLPLISSEWLPVEMEVVVE